MEAAEMFEAYDRRLSKVLGQSPTKEGAIQLALTALRSTKGSERHRKEDILIRQEPAAPVKTYYFNNFDTPSTKIIRRKTL
tara:strand:- start:704 stop:946 length:243 start_codon:yes stop_codon:yes gene_type:complete